MRQKGLWAKKIKERLLEAEKRGLYRSMRIVDTIEPGYVVIERERYLNLCANDYLGLSADSFTLEEGKILADIIPPGAAASRLITGNFALHQELERILADWKETEAALVFPSGYQTNVGLLTSLTAKGDAIFSDRLNHASIVDGCLLSGATLHRYRHNDLDDLETLLKTKRPRKRLIVTDGVFSMDGDLAPLREINELAKQYEALLVVDEAHASGVLGNNGSGTWSHFELPWEKHVILMGTLSKAIGCQGGFICASREIIDYLINFCRSFIYSTGLSPYLAGLAHYNITRIRTEPSYMESLRRANQTFREALHNNGLETPDLPTPIIPLILGGSGKALACAKALEEEKIIALAIRPPTVPEGTERLRLTISAAHKTEDLQHAAAVIAREVQKMS